MRSEGQRKTKQNSRVLWKIKKKTGILCSSKVKNMVMAVVAAVFIIIITIYRLLDSFKQHKKDKAT